MTLTEIQEVIKTLLRNSFTTDEIKKIYDEDIKQRLLKPCFIVSLIPVTTKNEKYYKVKSLMVKITYVGEKGTYAENLVMTDKLQNIFGLSLNVGDRYLIIKELNPIIYDNILSYGFNLELSNGVEVIELINVDGEKVTMLLEPGYTQDNTTFMGELEIKQEV